MMNIYQAADRLVQVHKRQTFGLDYKREKYGSVAEFLRQNALETPSGYAYFVHSWDAKDGIAEIIEWSDSDDRK